MPENDFDRRIAATFGSKWPQVFAPTALDPMVEFLAARAGPGPVLELAVGTGRVALPLARRGLRVHGIELSPDMVAELRRQPGGDGIDVTVGDMASTRVEGTFALVYLVANTIMNLTTQDAQVACFERSAEHLGPGGCFVIEVMVPALRRLPPGETVVPFACTPAHVGFEGYDVATQSSWSHHWWDENGRLETFSAPFRYVWPAELDLMARLAGLTLRERWENWHSQPFTSESRSHISVWEKGPRPRGD